MITANLFYQPKRTVVHLKERTSLQYGCLDGSESKFVLHEKVPISIYLPIPSKHPFHSPFSPRYATSCPLKAETAFF